jgi:hypothetical protein
MRLVYSSNLSAVLGAGGSFLASPSLDGFRDFAIWNGVIAS